MSVFAVVLLAAATLLVLAAAWPRLAGKLGTGTRGRSARARVGRPRGRKAKLQVVRPDSEEFARAVERDLAALPTIDEQDARRH